MPTLTDQLIAAEEQLLLDIKNGKKERLASHMDSQRAGTAALIQLPLLEEMTEALYRLVQLQELNLPHGLHETMNLTVTPAIIELNPGTTVTMPWKAMTVYNDGPGVCFFTVNKDYFENYTPIRPTEKLEINLNRDQIKKILWTSSPAQPAQPGTASAAVRIFYVK